MDRRPWALIAAVGIAAAIAIGVSAWIFIRGSEAERLIALAIVMLAILPIALVLDRETGRRARRRAIAALEVRARKLGTDLAALDERVTACEDVIDELPETAPGAAAPSEPEPANLTGELDQLRRSLRKLADDYGVVTDAPPPPPLPPEQDPLLADKRFRLELYLEPIVELKTNATKHYRASLALETPEGKAVPFEELAYDAGRHRLRADLDVHCLGRTLAAATRLTTKKPGTFVFVPVGPETLASRSALDQIADFLTADSAAAASIIFEIDHPVMASLNPAAVEGLARLARSGAGLSLGRAHGLGVDLSALKDLRFRFICFGCANLVKDALAVPAWAGLARFGAENGFEIALQGVAAPDQGKHLQRWAEYASGPGFAAPRKVKNDLPPVRAARSAAA